MINSAMVGGVALEPRQRNQSLINANACGGIELTAADNNTTVFLFASILRSDPMSLPTLKRVAATCEHEARRQLVREYVLVFAGRVVRGGVVRHERYCDSGQPSIYREIGCDR